MQDTWSHLPLIVGLIVSLVSASLVQSNAMMFPNSTVLGTPATPAATHSLGHGNLVETAGINFHNSTPLVALIPGNFTANQSVDHDLMQKAAINSPTLTTFVKMTTIESLNDEKSIFDPVPTTSPTLSIISDFKAPESTPGSIAIIDGVAVQVLNDTLNQTTRIHADTVATPQEGRQGTPNLWQPWNTSYPGEIHHGDWVKYLQIWDPVWWSLNLDSLRQTSCHCSAADYLSNPQAQVGSFMNFQYYSHQIGAVYSLNWGCGPAPSSIMTLSERITSGKRMCEHCWQAAGGDYSGDHRVDKMRGYFCDAQEEFCVEPWRENWRKMTFHGHKRAYDRSGVHTWSELQPLVKEVCEPICRDKFLMEYNDYSPHNPNFITTFYPPKPIDLTIFGD